VTKPDAMAAAARKKDKEENETLDDLQQNEVERGSIQPLLKTNSEAAERCSSEPPMCYGDLMRGGQMEMRTENCEPFQPRPLRPGPPVVFKPCVFFSPPSEPPKSAWPQRPATCVTVTGIMIKSAATLGGPVVQ
jgi:hypothetical protein